MSESQSDRRNKWIERERQREREWEREREREGGRERERERDRRYMRMYVDALLVHQVLVFVPMHANGSAAEGGPRCSPATASHLVP